MEKLLFITIFHICYIGLRSRILPKFWALIYLYFVVMAAIGFGLQSYPYLVLHYVTSDNPISGGSLSYLIYLLWFWGLLAKDSRQIFWFPWIFKSSTKESRDLQLSMISHAQKSLDILLPWPALLNLKINLCRCCGLDILIIL